MKFPLRTYLTSCGSVNAVVSTCAVSIRSPDTSAASTDESTRYEYISEKYREGLVVSVTTPPDITRYGRNSRSSVDAMLIVMASTYFDVLYIVTDGGVRFPDASFPEIHAFIRSLGMEYLK